MGRKVYLFDPRILFLNFLYVYFIFKIAVKRKCNYQTCCLEGRVIKIQRSMHYWMIIVFLIF